MLPRADLCVRHDVEHQWSQQLNPDLNLLTAGGLADQDSASCLVRRLCIRSGPFAVAARMAATGHGRTFDKRARI